MLRDKIALGLGGVLTPLRRAGSLAPSDEALDAIVAVVREHYVGLVEAAQMIQKAHAESNVEFYSGSGACPCAVCAALKEVG